MKYVELETHQSFGGQQKRFRHWSVTLDCEMSYSVYLPPDYRNTTLPILYWLSGLTCNDQNFVTKAGAQKYAAELGIILVVPDTSPRGDIIPDAPSYDLGQGASFYVNATQEPWKQNYQMFDYISIELPKLIKRQFKSNGKQSIAGHSMGGHGALMFALKHPSRFCSVSAFAPIVNPMQVPFGRKAFCHYLGDSKETWQVYDSCFLMEHYIDQPFPILIDQGTKDEFLLKQLQPEILETVALKKNWPFQLRWQKDYDHSYFFVSSFIRDHLLFHYRYLK